MKVYLVGGAVRDQLMGRDVTERDWVVVGASADDLTVRGFKPVGRDFPVFLHPDTHEEYALARTERKTARGYHGFQFYAAPDVTLEQDLARRDLTINAIAMSEAGDLIDPFNGAADIQAMVFRHVSPAFQEDPVRLLRLARFAARFPDFSIADATQHLLQEIVNKGEVDELVPERVWQETHKALTEIAPERFLQVLRDCGALEKIFPEIHALYGVPQPEKHHPEIDTGVHNEMVLEQAAKLSNDALTRFAALVHDLGKGTTPKDILPSHHGHEERGARLVREMAQRLRIPNDYRDIGILMARYHTHIHRAAELKPATVLKTLTALDAFRRPDRFELLLVACEADSKGRTGFEQRPYPQANYFRACFALAAGISLSESEREGLSGQQIAEAIKRRRVKAIASIPKPGLPIT